VIGGIVIVLMIEMRNQKLFMHFSEDGFWLNQVWSSGKSMAKVVNEKPATMDLFTTGQNWCF